MFRILVTGSRDYTNRELLERTLAEVVAELHDWEAEIIVVHGAAPGADTMAAEWAEKLGYATEAHPANWSAYGRGAGPLRNQVMVDLGAAVCVAFPGPKSRGTWDCVRRAERWGIRVHLVHG